MATIYTEQTKPQVNQLYDQAVASTQQQIPAIAQLFQALSEQINQGAAADQEAILTSAARRGVSRPSLPGQVAAAMAPGLAVAQAQQEVDRTGMLADTQGALTQLGTNRHQDWASLADALASGNITMESLQDKIDLEGQKHLFELQQLERGLMIDLKKEELRKAEEARRKRATDLTIGSWDEAEGEFLSYYAKQLKAQEAAKGRRLTRQEQDVIANAWFSSKGIQSVAARQAYWDTLNDEYGRTDNPFEDHMYQHSPAQSTRSALDIMRSASYSLPSF